MGKLYGLFLSLLVILCAGCSRLVSQQTPSCDCNNKKVQDSLLNKYLDQGAYQLPNSYNHPHWQKYCDSLIAICPNIAYAYRQKAIPYIKNGDYEIAFALNNKAVELNPKEWTAYLGFLKCIFTKDYEGALVDFKKAQELTPNGYEMDHTFLFYQGLCNIELGNWEVAKENLLQDRFIQTGGDPAKESNVHYNTYLYLGILLYEMNQTEQAKEYLFKCLAIFKELPDANYYLALVYKQEKNTVLEKKYLQLAKDYKLIGYGLNEDNEYYAYYPHQITLYEINQALNNEAQHD
jgi:tetratricopeptide (TPR) repeat protein